MTLAREDLELHPQNAAKALAAAAAKPYQLGIKTTDEQDTEQWGGGATMPVDSVARKMIPLVTGLIDYFPDSCIAVAEVSHKGNAKHNPGEALHWARGKGGNNIDEAVRHILERGGIDETDDTRHLAKAAWRIMAALQIEIEAARRDALSGAPDVPLTTRERASLTR